MKTIRVPLSLCLLCSAALAAQALAQEPAVAEAAETDSPAAHEQSIYVPYEKLWKVFEKEGRGVFLPYEAFMRLWREAEGARPDKPVLEPPVAAAITEVSGQALVGKDVVTVTADVTIDILKKGWHRVPVRLGNVAITKASVDGNPAQLVKADGGGYELLVHLDSDKPKAVRLAIEFAKSYDKMPGRNSVSFDCPVAPVSRWELRIPQAGVDVDIQPLLAATEVPPKTLDADETHMRAFIGASPTLRIAWTPRAEGAKGLKSLADVRADHEVNILEGVTRTKVVMNYTISRTETDRFEIEAPSGHKVVNVFDQNVREWSVKRGEKAQVISVLLFEAVKGSQPLVVQLEKFSEDAHVEVPVVKAVGVGRQRGAVVVNLGPGLRAKVVAQEALLQLDAKDLPEHLAKAQWGFSYRYAAVPFALAFDVESVQPRVLVSARTLVSLEPESLSIQVSAVYDVQKAGVFQLAMRIPGDMEVREVRGAAGGGATAAQVDSHNVDDLDQGRKLLTVQLSRKAQGPTGLFVLLHRVLDAADLLSPTGNAVTIPIPVPRATGDHVEREDGRLAILAPQSLRINVGEPAGLRPVPYNEVQAYTGLQLASSPRRPVVSFAYGDQDVALTLSAERRAPHVTVRQLLSARIEAGVVKYNATFYYRILYSGVKALHVDVPADIADEIRVTTPGVRRTPVSDADRAKPAEGYVAWKLEGETEFEGSKQVHLRWEEKIESLDVGRSVTLSIPRLVPVHVNRASGQIVLSKAEAIDVAPAKTYSGLRPIDPRQDLLPGVQITDAARAFEFLGDWELSVVATRYEPREVKATSIERGLVRMVLTRGDLSGVQAIYRMKSARQRLVVNLPGEVSFDTQPLRINGRPLSLEQGEAGDYFIPLVNQEPDKPFVVELRYVVKGAGNSLRVPEFPQEPAAQQIYLSSYFPADRSYLGYKGPWNDEIVWMLDGFNSAPRGNKHANQLINWVAEGVETDPSSLRSFATDGRHVLYSTLRPKGGEEEALQIVTVKTMALQTILLVIILAGGLLLVRTRIGLRFLAVGTAFIAIVLLAVYTPSLARAVLNNGTAGACLIVLAWWLLWFFLVTLPRSPAWEERKRERQAAREARSKPPPIKRSAPPPGPESAKQDEASGPDKEEPDHA